MSRAGPLRIMQLGCAVSALATIICCSAFADAQESLPRKNDLTSEFQKLGLAALAQGDRDDCSLFAITALAEFESEKHSSAPPRRLSEEFLIWASDRATRQTGDQAMFYKAVEGLNSRGICSAELMPYSGKPNSRRNPSPESLADARQLRERWQVDWIKRWSTDAQLTDRQLLQIKRALVHGHPVACGLRWPKTLNGYKLFEVPPPDKVSDGHSIAFVGYEDDPRQNGGGVLKFRNSFGPNWGQHGYGLMSYAYARAYANDALHLTIGPPGSEIPTARYEAESMPIVGREHCQTSRQSMKDWDAAMWSRGEQLFCNATRGGAVALAFDVAKPGRYRVRVLATAAPDYGIIHAALDDRNLPPTFDLYAGQVCPAGSLEIGTHELSAGRHRLRFTSVGKNPASQGFSFGLDAVDLIAAR